MMKAYFFLAVAIIAEVVATGYLQAAAQFTRLIPSIIVVISYGVAFYALSWALKTIPVAIAYAIWAGLGVVVITLIGIFFYRQIPDVPAVIGLAMILGGVLVINLFSNVVGH